MHPRFPGGFREGHQERELEAFYGGQNLYLNRSHEHAMSKSPLLRHQTGSHVLC